MGHRLSKLTTRTGDQGETGIAGNRRLPKHSARITAIGDVDELNCCLGLLQSQDLPTTFRPPLDDIQQQLFNLGGELAMPEMALISAEAVATLEQWTDTFNAELPPLKEFVIPGGGLAASHAHLARAVCRRAERSVWACHAEEPLRTELPQYLNRLSDLLFVFCRILSRQSGQDESMWQRDRSGPESG